MKEDSTDINISLTVIFNKVQEIPIPAGKRLGFKEGKAVFGIKRGTLKLFLNNCIMPLEKIKLATFLDKTVEVENTTSREASTSAGVSETGFNSSMTGKMTISKTWKSDEPQITFAGPETSPTWIFEVQGQEDDLLVDDKQKEPLGILETLSLPCKLKATFNVKSEDVHMVDGSLFGAKEIIRNKFAIIERLLAKRYIKPEIESAPFSEITWDYD
ncbi:hypothetical protein SPB21_35280 [Leptothoe sp. ISB3NOV94-8A]